MKVYGCPGCGGRVYFENMVCLNCGVELGYVAGDDTMIVANNAAPLGGYRPCANRSLLLCNWMAAGLQAADESLPVLCGSCGYTRTLPPLDKIENRQALARLEQAKRYLLYSLYALHLPVPNRVQQPESGLAFDFLAQLSNEPRVLTGHDSGIITINIAEADDAKREQRRIALHESYRTVLGHLRHEIGHFYWNQLLANSELLHEFRQCFGDERIDYAAALQNHYQAIDDGGWRGQYISYYASAHPWEDWAETWAHYLHINDALDTASVWDIALKAAGTSLSVRALDADMDAAEFSHCLVTNWLPLAQYLNAACRSLGEPDAYPFVLPPPVVDKLAFVHRVLGGGRTRPV